MIRKGSQTTLPIPESYKALAYIASGQVLFKSDQVLTTGQLALFDKAGELVQVEAEEDASIIFLAGEPIDEPVTRRGFLVMNSESEIVETSSDYRKGKLGSMAVART
jgi:redox-sensitive bicupin YhaK (pirin superfamily)